MKRLLIAILTLFISSTAHAQTGSHPICYAVPGMALYSQPTQRTGIVGTYNYRGKGTAGLYGNRFTYEAFDYDMCMQSPSFGLFCEPLFRKALDAWASPYALDCQNMTAFWKNNYGAPEQWYQADRTLPPPNKTSVYGTLFTDQSSKKCGRYGFSGSIDGSGNLTVAYYRVESTPLPAGCYPWYNYYGVTDGPRSAGYWQQGVGGASGSYRLTRVDPMPQHFTVSTGSLADELNLLDFELESQLNVLTGEKPPWSE